MKPKFCFFLYICFFASEVSAMPLEKLNDLLKPYRSFSGNFVQIVNQSKKGRKRVIDGRIAIGGKSSIFWETYKPFQQKIVSDGNVLWIFDEDLMQAQVRSIKEAFVSSPVRILVGSVDDIARDFFVRERILDNQVLFTLTPKSNDQAILEIEFFFQNDILTELLIVNSLGMSTKLVMKNQIFKAPDKKLFNFKPPPGTDIVYSDGMITP